MSSPSPHRPSSQVATRPNKNGGLPPAALVMCAALAAQCPLVSDCLDTGLCWAAAPAIPRFPNQAETSCVSALVRLAANTPCVFFPLLQLSLSFALYFYLITDACCRASLVPICVISIYFCVVRMSVCPRMLAMVVTFVPFAAIVVANVCRMACGLN